MYSNRRRLDCIRGRPVSPNHPLFRHQSHVAHTSATRKCHGRAAAEHVAPPDHRAGPTPSHGSPLRGAARSPSPTPHHVSYKGCPVTAMNPLFLPLSSYLMSMRLITLSPPSSLSSASFPPRPTGIPPLCHCPPSVSSTVPHHWPLLDRASPPPSPPPAAGLVDALPGHRSSATALERRRAGLFSLPHCHWPSLVRTPLPHFARRNRHRPPPPPVESLSGVLHLGHRRNRAGRATACMATMR
jgi:hypothetical protein